MKNIRYTLSVAWKEIQVFTRDRGAMALLLLFPILLSSVQGGANVAMAAEGETPSILLHVGLVNEDSGTFGSEVSKAIQSIEVLAVETFTQEGEAEGKVAKGEAAAAIVIPADFSEKIDAYTPVAIEVVVDPAQPESVSIITGIMNQVVDEVTIWGEVQYGIRTVLDNSGLLDGATPEQRAAVGAQNLGVIMTRLNEMRRNPAIEVISEDLEGEASEGGLMAYLSYVFAAYIVLFIFFVVGTCAESIQDEREMGTLRRLVAAPIPRGAVIGGKMLGYMLIPCLQAVILFAIGHFFFDIPLGQSPAGLIVLTIVVAGVSTSLGLLLATLVKSKKQAGDMGTLLGFVLGFAGGAIPIAPLLMTRMEGAMSILSRFVPHANAIEAYYRLVAENASLMDILPEIGILVGMILVFLLIAVRRFKFD
ncbi:MAG TPA: ABC transporter permease [Anaerolineae bacterium]|nr:ABC transporter permease [Anaerolineae bacterium]